MSVNYEAISAIGTVAAAVVGLGGVAVALWQNFKFRTEAEQLVSVRAHLYAARISARLMETATLIRDFSVKDGFDDLPPLALRQQQLQRYEALQHLFKKGFFVPDEAALVALIPLPNRCAHRLGRAYDLVQNVKRSVAAFESSDLPADPLEAARFKLHVDGWFEQLSAAATYLQTASEECITAADLGAPFPSAEELNGDSPY